MFKLRVKCERVLNASLFDSNQTAFAFISPKYSIPTERQGLVLTVKKDRTLNSYKQGAGFKIQWHHSCFKDNVDGVNSNLSYDILSCGLVIANWKLMIRLKANNPPTKQYNTFKLSSPPPCDCRIIITCLVLICVHCFHHLYSKFKMSTNKSLTEMYQF